MCVCMCVYMCACTCVWCVHARYVCKSAVSFSMNPYLPVYMCTYVYLNVTHICRFLDSAISPSVLVPNLLNLEDHGYGVAKGIPTMLIVAAAFDDVICISLFTVFLSVIFNSGPLVFSILRGPIEVVLGLLYGVGCGLLMWYIPPKDFVSGPVSVCVDRHMAWPLYIKDTST